MLCVIYGGMLEFVDYIIDEFGIRFCGVLVLDVVMLDGCVFIFVGGVDDGILVFIIMFDGYFLYFVMLIDVDDRVMVDVLLILVVVIDGCIVVFVVLCMECGVM